MIYSKLTEAQQAAYLKDPSKCPFCQSEAINRIDAPSHGDDRVVEEFRCTNCGRDFMNCYQLIAVDESSMVCEECNEILNVDDEVELCPPGGLAHKACLREDS